MRIEQVISILVGFMLSASTAALAQTVEVSKAQDALIVEAVEATREGDLTRAEEKYRAALELGSINIIHAGLGRTLQRAGDCDGAEEVFKDALSAPAASAPYTAPKELGEVIERYLSDMATLCKGEVVIVCPTPSMVVRVDGELQSCGQRAALSPGPHRVVGLVGSAEIVRDIEVVGRRAIEVRLDAPTAQVLEPVEESTEAVKEEEPLVEVDSWGVWSAAGLWSLMAGGALTLTGVGLAVAQGINDEEIRELAAGGLRDVSSAREASRLETKGERLQVGQWVTFGVGSAALALGSALVFVEPDGADGSRASLRVVPWLSPGQAGLGLEWRR